MADPVPDLDLDHLLNECEEEFIQILKENLKLPCESRGYLPTSSSLNHEEQCDDREEVKFRVRQLINLGSSAADIIDFVFSVKQQGRNIYMADKTIDVFNPSSKHEASTSIEKESVMGFEDQPEMTIEGEVFGKPEQMGGSMAAAIGEEAVVGVEDEAYEIKSWLMAERKKLDAVSIVGMPGLGKTTLARKLYHDDSVVSYFNIRAWVYVSQIYEKNNLLLGILSSPYIQLTSDLTDKDLSEELYQCLKGKRYLIVLDDIWDIRVWNDLKGSFPDDNRGSRILFTTRTKDGAFHAQLNSRPHLLRFLNENESWVLLKEKVFHKESCSTMLMEVGKQIARKCAGLPLAIVVVAGLLAKKEKTKEWWERVAESVSSYMVNDREQYMDTLALSYHHLPDHLQPCFLYFGAFPEDYEIPVWKLIWLWVAEGFIKKHGEESLEDVATDCLNDLIERSLIIVANKRSDGGVKSCRIHDMLHDLCLRKAEEEGFLQRIRGYEQVSSSSSWRRLCIHSHLLDYISSMPSAPDVHSLLCFDSRWNVLPREQSSFICPAFGHLRVLDLWYIRIQIFPIEMKELVHLRYVALRCDINEIPPSYSPTSGT